MVNTAAFRPRPGITVIPDSFITYHEPTVDGTHLATVELWTGPAAGEPAVVWNDVTHTETRNYGTRVPDMPVAARIQNVSVVAGVTAGSQDVTTRSYRVTTNQAIPEGLTVSGFVKIVDGDPYLEGRYLSVEDIHGGTFAFERVLVCLDNLG